MRAQGWEPGSGGGWNADLVVKNYSVVANAKLKWENKPLAAVAIELLSKNQPDTVRGVMYSVVSAGWLPDTSHKSYSRIQRLLNVLRKKGVIPFEWIVDNVREAMKPSSWSGLDSFTDTVRDAYRKNYWASLPEFVAVVVEKDTVAGRIEPVTNEYDVPLYPLRGYSSTSFAWGIARDWKRIAKPITVFYIGDHDPSGRDIERSVIESLKEYGATEFKWVRLGVNPEHFEQFKIIPLAVKTKDRRCAAFVSTYGEKCAEVEAIPAADLRGMVKRAILTHIPPDSWARLQAIEKQEQQSWTQVMDAMQRTGG